MPSSHSALSLCGSPMWACSFPCLVITQNGTTNLSSTPATPVLRLPAGTMDVPPRSPLQTKVFASPSCSQCWLLTALSCSRHRKSTLTWHDLPHQEIEVSTHVRACKHASMCARRAVPAGTDRHRGPKPNPLASRWNNCGAIHTPELSRITWRLNSIQPTPLPSFFLCTVLLPSLTGALRALPQ